MEELGSNLSPGPAESVPSKEKKRRGKRKQEEAASLGGLAAESLIWQREKESPATPEVPKARPILDALLAEKEKNRETEKPKPNEAAETKRATEEPETTADTKEDATTVTNEETAEASEYDTAGAERDGASPEMEDVESRDGEDGEELDSTLTTLTPEETQHATSEYLQIRRMELAAEQADAETGSEEAAALAADEQLLAKISDKLEADPDMPTEAAATEAMDEVMAELGVEEPEAHVAPAETGLETPAPPMEAAEATPIDPPDVPAPTTVPAARAAQPVSTAMASGNMAPPIPPAEYEPPAAAEPPERPVAARAARTSTEHVIPYDESLYMERRAQTRGLLVGGVLGYLIGRRRGRIKTEKRMRPIQEKLEKQVEQLHEVIARKEREVRVVAAEKAYAARHTPIEVAAPIAAAAEAALVGVAPDRQVVPVQASQAAAAELRPEPIGHTAPVPQMERAPFVQPIPAFGQETAPQPAPAPIANFENFVPPAAAVALATEHMQPYARNAQAEQGAANSPAHQIEMLNTEELLEVAAHVRVGKENLRAVYEERRITEPGLRHILIEYVRGGNVKKVLKQELTNKEMTYERDPRLRKHLAATLSSAGTATGAVAAVAAKAKPKISEKSKKLAIVSKNAGAKAIEKSRQIEEQDKEMQQFILRMWMGVTIFLALIAIVLLLR
jgi:hypothetical protein